jgi:beta-carotene 15,15'-dioxygenase
MMSAFHFGQSHFINLKLKKFEILTFLSLGLFFLSVILWGDFDYTESILSSIYDIGFVKPYGIVVVLISFVLSGWLMVINFGYKSRVLLLEVILLGMLLYNLPLLLSFIIYFGFWHSLPSMGEEFEAIKDHLDSKKIPAFIKKLLPFTLLSLLGIYQSY